MHTHIKNLLELIKEQRKGKGTDLQQSVAFLSTSKERPENEVKKTAPFTTASESIKCSRINLIKEAEDFYTKKYKVLEALGWFGWLSVRLWLRF